MFLKDPSSWLRRLTEQQCDLELLLPKASKDKYSNELASDITKSLSRLGKMIKTVKKVMPDESMVSRSEVPKLVDAIENEGLKFQQILEWAIKFGFMKARAQKKRKA